MSSGYSFMPPSSLRGDSLRRVAANLTEPWRWTFLSCSMCLFMCSVRMCVQRFHASRVSCMHPCACGRLLFQSACTCTTCGTRSQTVTYWNACGLLCVAFPSLKGLVDLNADCHDVSSKPQRCLLCVTVTIYFRPVCEKKKRLHFHLRDSLTWTVRSKHCATVPGPEPPPRWMRSLIFALTQPVKNNRVGRRRMRDEPLGDSLII